MADADVLDLVQVRAAPAYISQCQVASICRLNARIFCTAAAACGWRTVCSLTVTGLLDCKDMRPAHYCVLLGFIHWAGAGGGAPPAGQARLPACLPCRAAGGGGLRARGEMVQRDDAGRWCRIKVPPCRCTAAGLGSMLHCRGCDAVRRGTARCIAEHAGRNMIVSSRLQAPPELTILEAAAISRDLKEKMEALPEARQRGAGAAAGGMRLQS